MQSVEELAAYYEAKPRPECPSCHSAERVAFIVMGRPTANLVAYAERPDSRIRLGGCLVDPDNNPRLYCRSCDLAF
jgi:hypothetical protein